MTRLVFIDVESTGLDPLTHEVWEIAMIERRDDGTEHESHFFVRPQHLETADPNALKINRFYERTCSFTDEPSKTGTPGPHWTGSRTVAQKIARVTAGAVLVGSNPAYDAAMLTRFLKGQKLTPAWHYRQIDVPTMAYGYIHGAVAHLNVKDQEEAPENREPYVVDEEASTPAFASHKLSVACGVIPPGVDEAHTALADTRWVRDWYDALVRGEA